MSIMFKLAVREIRRNFGRFMSIVCITAIGIAFFAGVRAAEPDMKESADRYFDDYHLFDLHLKSTTAFDDDDIAKLNDFSGGSVYAGFSADMLAVSGESTSAVRVYSYNDNVNTVQLTDGRMPMSDKECIVDCTSIRANIKIGDKITLATTDDSAVLNNTELNVVGLFESPMYISGSELGSTTIGSGVISNVIYVRESNFALTDYTDVYLRYDSLTDLDCYSDAYIGSVDSLVERIDGLNDERVREIYGEQLTKLEKQMAAQQDMLDALQLSMTVSNDRIADAQKELEDSKADLDEMRDYLDQYGKLVGMTHEEATEYFSARTKEMETLRADINKYSDDYTERLNKYNTDLAALTDKYTEAKEKYDAAVLKLNGSDPDKEAQLTENYNKKVAQLDEEKARLDLEYESLVELNATVNEYIEAYNELAESLKSESDEVDGGEFNRDNYLKLELKYAVMESDYQLLESKVQQINMTSIAEAVMLQSEINQIKSESNFTQSVLDIYKLPRWITYTRGHNPGYVEYGQNAERVGNIGKVFPVFFLAVAALVCLNAMTRMSEEKRGEMGTLKALGVSGGQVMQMFLIYASLATVIGCIVGVAVGFKLFPFAIIQAYGMMYRVPVVYIPYRPMLAALSSAAMLACILITAAVSCGGALRRTPAELIRPKAPRSGKHILLERVRPVWRHMNFIKKVTARNIFRYKKRMIMIVIGIAGCTALTLTGFGLRDSINDVVDLQYNKIWKYDAAEVFTDFGDATLDEVLSAVHGADENAVAMPVYQGAIDIKTGDNSVEATVFVPQQSDRLSDYVLLNSRTEGEQYTLGDSGVILTEKAAKLLNVSVGDKVTLIINDKEYSVPIDAVCENYVAHYAFMSPQFYSGLLSDECKYNTVLISYSRAMSADKETQMCESLLGVDSAMSVTVLSDKQDVFSDMMDSLNIVVVVLIISAGLLAFVVLYNLTLINITERERELSVMKVLGFYGREVSAYIFRESIVLTVIGIVFGLGVGRLLTGFVITTAEIDMVMFGREIYLPSYLLAAAITLVFAVIVSLFMRRKITDINMAESLKSVE